jgi:hypothetical protein
MRQEGDHTERDGDRAAEQRKSHASSIGAQCPPARGLSAGDFDSVFAAGIIWELLHPPGLT